MQECRLLISRRLSWTAAGECAGGLGRLLAQQLIAAGERVLDVQPMLASRVRLLPAGDTNKNDPPASAASSSSPPEHHPARHSQHASRGLQQQADPRPGMVGSQQAERAYQILVAH